MNLQINHRAFVNVDGQLQLELRFSHEPAPRITIVPREQSRQIAAEILVKQGQEGRLLAQHIADCKITIGPPPTETEPEPEI